MQPKNSTRTILVSDNPIARLEEDNVKTELAVEETISQSEPQLQNTDVGTSHKDEAPHQLQSTNNPNHQSLHEHQQETENNPRDLENQYPKTEGGCNGFKETSRN